MRLTEQWNQKQPHTFTAQRCDKGYDEGTQHCTAGSIDGRVCPDRLYDVVYAADLSVSTTALYKGDVEWKRAVVHQNVAWPT